MHANEFAAQFYCQFSDRSDGELAEAAGRYVQATEAYDLTVCTGPNRNGEILPATSLELGRINQHAQRELDNLCEQFAGKYSRREILQAIRRYDSRYQK
ncbi:hypothetical protein AAZU54_06465 [Pseudomonas sp. Je.1.5.c]|uniref:hypothetical protein n=1 Tax=Pseudomonas sp. Je.1.5.c TaxID=3142839 RepID=UPI003DA7C08D